MENTIPGVLGTLKQEDSTASRIRLMPDFIVQEPDSNKVFFVEVKYRNKGKYNLEKKYQDYAYGETGFIIASTTEFQLVSYKDLLRDGRVTEENNLSLNKKFNISSESEKYFLKMTRKFYERVWINISLLDIDYKVR